MTGYTVHTGSNIKFSGGWDRIFSGKADAETKAKKKSTTAKKPAKKKSSKKKK